MYKHFKLNNFFIKYNLSSILKFYIFIIFYLIKNNLKYKIINFNIHVQKK